MTENTQIKKKIEEYVQILEKIRDQPPSLARLEEIKKRIGLKAEEEIFLERLVESHIYEALEQKEKQEELALAQLRRAHLIDPRNIEVLKHLTGIYLERCLKRGFLKGDRKNLERLLLYGDRLQIEDASYRLFREHVEEELKRSGASGKDKRVFFLLASILFFFGGLLVVRFYQIDLWGVLVNRRASSQTGQSPAKSAPSREERFSSIPVSTEMLKRSGLEFTPYQSKVEFLKEQVVYVLGGITKSSEKSLSELELELKAEDSDKKVLFSKTFTPLSLPPGGAVGFNQDIPISQKVSLRTVPENGFKTYLTIKSIKVTPRPKLSHKPVPLQIPPALQARGLSLGLTETGKIFIPEGEGGLTFYTFEIRNKGTKDLRALQLKLRSAEGKNEFSTWDVIPPETVGIRRRTRTFAFYKLRTPGEQEQPSSLSAEVLGARFEKKTGSAAGNR